MQSDEFEYVGFWSRFGAALIDTVLICVIIGPILTKIYGIDYWIGTDSDLIKGPADFLLAWIFPLIAVIIFWIAKQTTPGKMFISARIVDAETGEAPSTHQFIIRYIGYYVAMTPLLLGIFWVGFDPRKQGWHDKMAGTIVIRSKSNHKK
jgi:uncharacterized RDD family membrane protein YckC